MGELKTKLESLRDSKEWEKICKQIEAGQEEKNNQLMEGISIEEEAVLYSEADMIRHDITFIEYLEEQINIKDKDVKDALIKDLEKSKGWRVDRLLGKTHEYKLDNIIEGDAYMEHDLYRSENFRVECFKNLPNKLCGELEAEEIKVEAVEESAIQEQLDAMSNMEI